jgi:hypothetical protein
MLASLGDSFDGLAVHYYVYFSNGFVNDCRDDNYLANYLTDKPVYISESAAYYKWGEVDEFEVAQIIHFVGNSCYPVSELIH